MIRRKKLVMTLITALLVIILCLTIGYAALSKAITITTNKITQSKMTWNIGFQTGSITGAATTTYGSISCGTATATANTISGVAPVFNNATGRCAYTFKIRNSGTITGKISDIAITKPASICTTSGSTMTCGNIIYKLHYDTATSTSLVAVGNTIGPMSGTTPTDKTVVLTVEHNVFETTSYNYTSFAYKITFVQN